MESNPPRYGLLLSALGSIVLAISVFLPWYGVSLTAGGVGYAQQVSSRVVSQYGNAQLQSYAGEVHTSIGSLAGHQLVAVSAHQALKQISVLLLIGASVAILLSLFSMARGEDPNMSGAAMSIAGLGLLAGALVGFRMIDPPNPASGLLALSLREGAWLALAGTVTMMVGGVWPAGRRASARESSAKLQNAWAELSGWTPED
jgi:hypothetical protein